MQVFGDIPMRSGKPLDHLVLCGAALTQRRAARPDVGFGVRLGSRRSQPRGLVCPPMSGHRQLDRPCRKSAISWFTPIELPSPVGWRCKRWPRLWWRVLGPFF